MDLIASKESAGGGYEALNPSTTLPGATKMTISEVAREAARVGQGKGGTGAVGKYQQLPRYLVSRATAAGLNPDKDLFSPANQDLIAAKVNIGMNRGGNKWLAGKMSTEDFMQGLSQEFAVLPNASGAFAYGGQSSSIKPEDVKNSLNQVKTKYSGEREQARIRQINPQSAGAQGPPAPGAIGTGDNRRASTPNPMSSPIASASSTPQPVAMSPGLRDQEMYGSSSTTVVASSKNVVNNTTTIIKNDKKSGLGMLDIQIMSLG